MVGERRGQHRSDHSRQFYNFMKNVQSLDGIAIKSIAVFDDSDAVIGYLRPIGADVADAALLVQKLAAWRGAKEHAYPSRGPISAASTASWIENAVVFNPERLLFLVPSGYSK